MRVATFPQMTSRHSQSGVVLYIAMILLLLLAMLGIVGMRVTALQERMSANYRSANLAFQNTEATIRATECAIEDRVNRSVTKGCGAVPVAITGCEDAFDAPTWAMSLNAKKGKQIHIRSIGRCIAGFGSIAQGKPINEDANPVYQVSAYDTDSQDENAANSAIDTIIRP